MADVTDADWATRTEFQIHLDALQEMYDAVRHERDALRAALEGAPISGRHQRPTVFNDWHDHYAERFYGQRQAALKGDTP